MNKFLNNLTQGIQNMTGTTSSEHVIKFPASQAECGVDANRSYAKNCFIMSHNSHANMNSGFVYYNQTFTIKEQLEKGVRGLMVDVWPKQEGQVSRAMMFHGNETETRLAMAGGQPQSFAQGLTEVKQFLESHPTEVVTILFESYIEDNQTIQQALDESGITPLVFWCDGRDGVCPNVAEKGWPTINEMCAMSKRLVLMSNHAADGMPWEYNFAVENHFGNKSLDSGVWHLSRRDEYPLHTPPAIFFMNHFADSPAGAQLEVCIQLFLEVLTIKGVTHTMAHRNAKDNIMMQVGTTYNDCQAKGRPGRLPNHIAVDLFEFGDNGGVLEAVRAVNEMWKNE